MKGRLLAAACFLHTVVYSQVEVLIWGSHLGPLKPVKAQLQWLGGCRPLSMLLTMASPAWCLLQSEISQEGEGLAGDTPWTLSSASSHPAGPHSSQLCACARQDGGGEACVPSLPKSPVLAALWGLEVSLQPPSQSRTIPKDWGSPGFGPIFHPLL